MAIVRGLLLIALCCVMGCARPTSVHEAKGQAATVTVAKPEWFSCETDSDCMAEEGVCNSMSAINKLFQGQFLQYRDAMNRQLGCQTSPAVPVEGIPAGCVNNRCVVKPGKFMRPGAPSAE